MSFDMVSPVIGVPSLSSQTVWLPVSSIAPDGTPINPSVGAVQVAATKGEDPTAWISGAWEAIPIVVDGVTYYLAKTVIGTDLVLTKAYYFLWLKLLFVTPATVVRHSSLLIY